MDAQAKQQVVERIKQANKILVTVSNNPSVDQLAACVGLTLMLNKMEKHATAVFSGAIPSTIEFLKPEKTIETNTDSLRDFIISLDKAKADKLRYKVEDQVVRIFITPYRTSISEKDLVFSQGDFNVEAVIALGVQDRGQIDAAITAHGRILHDATVISINAGPGNTPNIGQINWSDPQASSLSEMLVSVSEAFGTGMIDNQIATSFLTGIVAATNRFKNPKTTPKVMTMAAQLMATGANQQLIAQELEVQPPPPPPTVAPKEAPKPPPPPVEQKKVEGILSVSHDTDKKDSPEVDIDPNEIHIDEEGNLKTQAELKQEVDKLKDMRDKNEQDQQSSLANVPAAQPLPAAAEPPKPDTASDQLQPIAPVLEPMEPKPTEPAAAAAVTQTPADAPVPGSHTLLDPMHYRPPMGGSFTANTDTPWSDLYNSVPMSAPAGPPPSEGTYGHAATVQPPTEANNKPQSADVESARSAVEGVYASAPFDPSTSPPVQALNASTVDMNAPAAAENQVPPPVNSTPSLPLPLGLTDTSPNSGPQSDLIPPDPPSVPPPLPLASNPGVVIPDFPTNPTPPQS